MTPSRRSCYQSGIFTRVVKPDARPRTRSCTFRKTFFPPRSWPSARRRPWPEPAWASSVDSARLPHAALLSAVFFVASLIHVPIGPADAHLVLNGLAVTGRLVRPFCTRFCVQWPEQQAHYPGSVVIGPLL